MKQAYFTNRYTKGRCR